MRPSDGTQRFRNLEAELDQLAMNPRLSFANIRPLRFRLHRAIRSDGGDRQTTLLWPWASL